MYDVWNYTSKIISCFSEIEFGLGRLFFPWQPHNRSVSFLLPFWVAYGLKKTKWNRSHMLLCRQSGASSALELLRITHA